MESLIDDDLVKVAIDTYNLEKSVEPSADALRAALRASLARFEVRVQERMARFLFARAEAVGLDTDEGLTLLEAGNTLMETLPSDHDRPEVEDGDIVEISLVGNITVHTEACDNCGHDDGSREWSITDRYTGKEFFFEDVDFSSMKVRFIAKDGELPDGGVFAEL